MQVSVQMTVALMWLFVTLSIQEMVRLNVTKMLSATCGKSLTLNCLVLPSQDGLSITQINWRLGERHLQLCNVDHAGEMTVHQNNTPSVFECNYTHGQLALTFQQVQPLDEGEYICKLRSNMGIVEQNTIVKLRDCYRDAYVELTEEGPTCTFTGVHPVGDVHWFQGPHAIPASSVKTMEHVEDGGWLTIRSTLFKAPHPPKNGAYSCSLQTSSSGSNLITLVKPFSNQTHSAWSSTGTCVPLLTFVGLILFTSLLAEL